MQLAELDRLLKIEFSTVSLKTTGTFAVAVPDKFSSAKRLAALVDSGLDRILPKASHYLAFGHAVR